METNFGKVPTLCLLQKQASDLKDRVATDLFVGLSLKHTFYKPEDEAVAAWRLANIFMEARAKIADGDEDYDHVIAHLQAK
jgi:hypothetical protein